MRIGTLAALIAGLTLTACDKNENGLDGAWPPMKWSHPNYETAKVENVTYYVVPVEGGDFGFRCKNYHPWLTDHVFEVNGEVWHSYDEQQGQDDHWTNHYENGWCSVDAFEDSVKIHFEPNTGMARKALIGVTAGDIFDCLTFLQATALYTETGK